MKGEINNIENINNAQESKYEDMDREYYNCIKNCAADLQNLSLNFFPSINAYACIPKLNAINSITFHPCISIKDYYNNTYSFKPLFTHHFFSDCEQVIGFESLKIDFYYTCDSYEVYMKLSGSITDQYENSNYIMLSLLQSLYITTPYPGGFVESEEDFLKILKKNELKQEKNKHKKSRSIKDKHYKNIVNRNNYIPPGFVIYEKKLSEKIYLQIRKCGFSQAYFKSKNKNKLDGSEIIRNSFCNNNDILLQANNNVNNMSLDHSIKLDKSESNQIHDNINKVSNNDSTSNSTYKTSSNNSNTCLSNSSLSIENEKIDGEEKNNDKQDGNIGLNDKGDEDIKNREIDIDNKKGKKKFTKYVTEKDLSKLYREYLNIIKDKKRKDSTLKEMKEKSNSLEKINESEMGLNGNIENVDKSDESKESIIENKIIKTKEEDKDEKVNEGIIEKTDEEKKKKRGSSEYKYNKYDYTIKSNFELLHRKVEWFYHWFIESASNIEYDCRWNVILPYIVFKQENTKSFNENNFIDSLDVHLNRERGVVAKKTGENNLFENSDEQKIKSGGKRAFDELCSNEKKSGSRSKRAKKGEDETDESEQIQIGENKDVIQNIGFNNSELEAKEYVLTRETVMQVIDDTLNNRYEKEEESYYSFHKKYDIVYLCSDLKNNENYEDEQIVKCEEESPESAMNINGVNKNGKKKIIIEQTKNKKGRRRSSSNNNSDSGQGSNKGDSNEDDSEYLYYYYLFGLATTYTFFTFQFDRNRISQFLIFPPMQNKGLGMKVLEKIYHLSIVNSNIKEITVEDPAASFTHLRDIITIKICIDLKILSPTILYPDDYLKEKNIEKEHPELDKKKFIKVCKETHKQITRMVETISLAGVLPHPAPLYIENEDKYIHLRKKEKKNENVNLANSMESFEASDACKDVRIKIKKRIKSDYIGNLINKNTNCMSSDVFRKGGTKQAMEEAVQSLLQDHKKIENTISTLARDRLCHLGSL
ncbi:histone acetyltransferase, putative [Plasmodium vinckei brucechwatti]|uniref:histone acetyltransferase n=1 Tax=Plasmodium vinckei brucechwatti TaxID=119398 RepID=A0A6V7S0H7_PLAVN|nr:histone acetyltransferase, putative [Plasmodium vinckei brucechwatti]